MKKLMLVACAVAFAGAVQASTCNWSISSSAAIFNGDQAPSKDTSWSSATAQPGLSWMLVYADGLSQADALATLRDGGSISSDNILASGTTGADGKIAKTTFTTDSSLLDSANKLNAYLLVDNADGDWWYLSATKASTADLSGGQTDISIATATSKFRRDTEEGKTAYGNAGWYTAAAAPEPTSGLLLLIGVAGLALRRRRA